MQSVPACSSVAKMGGAQRGEKKEIKTMGATDGFSSIKSRQVIGTKTLKGKI